MLIGKAGNWNHKKIYTFFQSYTFPFKIKINNNKKVTISLSGNKLFLAAKKKKKKKHFTHNFTTHSSMGVNKFVLEKGNGKYGTHQANRDLVIIFFFLPEEEIT